MTRVKEIMSRAPVSCRSEDSLNTAAQLMWDHDCGCVPVVDHLDRLLGIVTDRDIAMAAYTQGKALFEIPVSSVCSRDVTSCSPDDSLERAEKLMMDRQVRRLPVTDADSHVLGMLSLSDIARNVRFVTPAKGDGIGVNALSQVMQAVSRPRSVALATTRQS